MMTMAVEATFHGKELSALEKLISERSEWLGENTKDSAVATAVAAVKSLQAETKVANPRDVVFDFGLATEAQAVWRRRGTADVSSEMGTKGSFRRAVLVSGHLVLKDGFINLSGKYIIGEQPSSVWFYRPKIATKQGSIDRGKYIYILARSEADALKWATDNAMRRIKVFKSLAKNIWYPVMRALNEGEKPTPPMESFASAAIDQNQSATQTVSDNTLTIEVENNLRYATLALKSGPTGVSLALQRAANKIAGRLQQAYKNNYFFFDPRKEPQTPFPEIVRKRKK